MNNILTCITRCAAIKFIFWCGLILLARPVQSVQLINDWTNSSSAKWESPYWSLGILPASNQAVNITNSGYKAVNIDSGTFSAYPSSLTVSNLQVSAPSNNLSTLLLNYTGLAAPVKVLDSCT